MCQIIQNHRNIYLIYVRDGADTNIEAVEAYGENHKHEMTKYLLGKYGAYIDKVEHED